jgi:hypothetical protein
VPDSSASQGDQPHDDTPHDDTPHDDTPHDDIPHDDIPHDDIPHDDIPHDDTGDGDGDGDGDGGGCVAEGSLITMADRSDRAIETIEPGQAVLSRDGITGRLVPQLVIRNHRSRVRSTVVMEMTDGTRLEVSQRQPVILHDGREATALEIHRWMQPPIERLAEEATPGNSARRARFIPAGRHGGPIQLRTTSGGAIGVVSTRISREPRIVHWLETRDKKNFFALSIELPIQK